MVIMCICVLTRCLVRVVFLPYVLENKVASVVGSFSGYDYSGEVCMCLLIFFCILGVLGTLCVFVVGGGNFIFRRFLVFILTRFMFDCSLCIVHCAVFIVQCSLPCVHCGVLCIISCFIRLVGLWAVGFYSAHVVSPQSVIDITVLLLLLVVNSLCVFCIDSSIAGVAFNTLCVFWSYSSIGSCTVNAGVTVNSLCVF